MEHGNNAIFASMMPAKQHDSNTAIITPLCPRFMPRPWAFFRKLKARDLLHDIGAASPVAPDFSITTAASDACEFRSPTSRWQAGLCLPFTLLRAGRPSGASRVLWED